MSDMKVVITPELVERATQRDSRHCMIAEAIKAAKPHYNNILVDLATIRWTNPKTKKRYICLTPEIAAQALVDFDQGREIEPFAFHVAPIQSTPAKKSERGKRTLSATGSQLAITGGEPLVKGHLSGSPSSHSNRKANEAKEAALVPEDASNVKRSSMSHRQYGRRLLKG